MVVVGQATSASQYSMPRTRIAAVVALAAGDYQSAVSAFLDLCLCFGLVVVEVDVVVGY